MPSVSTQSLEVILQRIFGHKSFRAHQQEVCEAAASGRDVLLVMPTGAGKSLCYQLPSLARGGGWPTSQNRDVGHPDSRQPRTGLVISPLIALIDDQAGKLSALGLKVARIHSGLSREDARQACRDYLAGELDFLFVAPERLRVPGFPEMLAKRKPALIAIDEAHCISQWGHDFRPDYRTLGQHLQALRPSPVIALTATATPQVQRDIVAQLQLHEPAVFITGFRRENLAVEVVELSKPQRAEHTLKLLADAAARPAIVYASSRKSAEELAEKLGQRFSAAAYHAGLDAGTRERVQRAFLAGKLDVVVATIAFGMGVDKADVRTVVHVALPGSVEAYYQEIGRAGRDGLPSRTVLLYSFADRKMQEFFLEKNYPPKSDLERVARMLDDEYREMDELQRRLKLDRETLERVVEKLLAQGVAVTDMNGNVRATGERGWQAGYEAQVAFRREQIDRIMAFAEGHTCRMTALVQHFGEKVNAAACGLCDVCRPGSEGGSGMRQPTKREHGDLREILEAVAKRSTSTGKLFTEVAVTRDRKEFDRLLDGLARAALVNIANDTFRNPEGRDVTYRKVSITHEGRTPDDATLDTVWLRDDATPIDKGRDTRAKRGGSRSNGAKKTVAVRSHEQERVAHSAAKVDVAVEARREVSAPRIQPPAASKPAVAVALTGAQEALVSRLREWRSLQAKAAGLPSFFIFSDSVLRDIAVAGPQNIVALSSVRGLGQEKLDKFGAEVVALCKNS